MKRLISLLLISAILGCDNGMSEKVKTLEAENQQLKNEITALRNMQNKSKEPASNSNENTIFAKIIDVSDQFGNGDYQVVGEVTNASPYFLEHIVISYALHGMDGNYIAGGDLIVGNLPSNQSVTQRTVCLTVRKPPATVKLHLKQVWLKSPRGDRSHAEGDFTLVQK